MRRGTRRPPAPPARGAGLLIHRLADETVVYDLERHEGHCLNRGAAAVWEACDGSRSAAAIAARVSRELGEPVDEAFVYFALRRLERARLLQGPVEQDVAPRLSRRALAKRLGFIGAASVLLPTVLSIVAPTAVQAGASSCSAGECLFGGSGRRGCCCTNSSPRRVCEQFRTTSWNTCSGSTC